MRRLGEEIRDISMEWSACFIYLFGECCGAIPVRNVQEPEPTRKCQMLAQFILDFAKKGHASLGIAKEIIELGHKLQRVHYEPVTVSSQSIAVQACQHLARRYGLYLCLYSPTAGDDNS